MPNKLTARRFIFLLLFVFFPIHFVSQTNTSDTKQKITKYFNDYFELDRENIYVHLDKDVFFTNETIWFKGYVFNKKTNLPFYSTTNIGAQLIDETGTVISSQLLYATTGVFSGKIDLNKSFQSGYYYLQFYTNWMNNFDEDESYVCRVKIKNTQENKVPIIEEINTKKINLSFYPEGGNLIANIPNNIGAKVTDVNGNSLPNATIEILDENGKQIKSMITNSYGMAKFNFVPTNEKYKALVSYNNSVFTYDLPESTVNGISLEVNNYALEDKTMIKLQYNKEFGKLLKMKTLFLVIQKNEKSNISDLHLEGENNSKEVQISNEFLFSGINSIRIIDSDFNEWASRLVYKNEESDSNLSLNVGFKNENRMDLSGNSNLHDACVSASLLPPNTKIKNTENIIVSLLINSYLSEKIALPRNYFKEMTRSKKFEFDLMLLNQKKDKYSWKNIVRNTPKSNYSFENGLQIRGVIHRTTANTEKSRIQLKNIFSDVISSTEVIKNNEFFFEKTDVTDSLKVFCDLIDKADRTKKTMDYSLTVMNKLKKFNKNYIPIPYEYPENSSINDSYDLMAPAFDGESILLKEVKIKKEKSILKRENQSGNSYLRGYKIGVNTSGDIDVLNFIEQNGFYVNKNSGQIVITGRTRTSINGSPYTTPVVYIDDRRLMSFEELSGMRMNELDEIYISTTAIVPSLNNNCGVIKIYRKQVEFGVPFAKNGSKTILGGFKMITPFVNADYSSEFTTGFNNFGLIYWSPWILMDENGNFKIPIPNKNHKKIKAIIEGFSVDGKLISIEKEVDTTEN